MEELKAIESAYILGLVDEEIAEEGIISKIKDKMRSKNRISKEEFKSQYIADLEECREECFKILETADDKYNHGNAIFTIDYNHDDLMDLCEFKSKHVLVWLAQFNPIQKRSINHNMNGDMTVGNDSTNISPIIKSIVSNLNKVCSKFGFEAQYGLFNNNNIYIKINDLYVSNK